MTENQTNTVSTLAHVEGLTGMNLKDVTPLNRSQIALYLAGIMKPPPEVLYLTICDLSEKVEASGGWTV